MGRCLLSIFFALLIVGTGSLVPLSVHPDPMPHVHTVWVFPLSGDVTPPLAATLNRWFRLAKKKGPDLIILQIDTPGGLSNSMRKIIKDILASPVPVVGYVAPSGARAASAGTYILYACPLAAMAGGTNIGSATPVPIGGSVPLSPPSKQEKKGQTSSAQDTEERKIVNDAVAFIRSLADTNGRNGDWAAQAVESAANLPAETALKLHVVDLIASDIPHLITQLDGRSVRVKGHPLTLHLQPASLRFFHPEWKDRFLEILARPELAYFLFLLGVAGLAFEFSHPGFIVPGVTGLLSLILALYSFTILPVNMTGLLLLILGLSLMVAEVLLGAFGGLAIAGIISFFLGSLLFFQTPPGEESPPIHAPLTLIILLTLLFSGLFLGVLRLALKARMRPVITGTTSLKGDQGIAIETFQRKGRVRLHSEIWWATSPVPVREGDPVIIEGLSGLTLKVRPLTEEGS